MVAVAEPLTLVRTQPGLQRRAMDAYGRQMTYLRISLTDRCNFRCTYCLPDGYRCERDDAEMSVDEIRRLVATFRAELTSFERKKYVSASHAANKAMNLNSYISLMGGNYQEIATPLGLALVS